MSVDKLVDSSQLDADLTSVAAAIRTKGGTSGDLAFPAGFVSAIQAIPTGGGGASNVVTGTFKGTTAGAAMDVTLNYSGTGYPIAVLVFVEEGMAKTGGTFYETLQRYAIACFIAIKNDTSTSPAYNNSTEDKFLVYYYSKSSTSNAHSLSGSTATGVYVTRDISASNTVTSNIKLRSNTSMSAYILAGQGSGLMANINYRYVVIYSS